MRQNDVFAFVRISVTSAGPDVGQVAYVTRRSLHAAEPSVKSGVRKAIADGAEPDVSWPATVPTLGGEVQSIEGQTLSTVKDNGRRQTYSGTSWAAYYPLRDVGERYAAGDVLASCIEPAEVTCPGDVWDWKDDLHSAVEEERFPAVKAARFLGAAAVTDALRSIMEDTDNDWRLRLEAAASLAPIDDTTAGYLLNRALDTSAREGEQMEAVFALSELGSDAAVGTLVTIAGAKGMAPSEVRAAAAWGIGLGAKPTPNLLVPLLSDEEDIVVLHAAAAMPADLPDSVVAALIRSVQTGNLRDATTATHLLARHGYVARLLEIVDEASEDVRAIALLAIGDAPPDQTDGALAEVDSLTGAILRTIWAQRSDWLRAPGTKGGLDILAKQRVRL